MGLRQRRERWMGRRSGGVVEVLDRPDLGPCLAAATVVGWAAIVAGVTAPLERGGWLAVPVVVAAGGLGALLAGPVGAVVGVVVGALTVPVVVMLAAWSIETVGFARADRVWRVGGVGATAVARTLRTGSGWRVESVAACPRGRGAGVAVMTAIVEAADAERIELDLVVASPRVVRWYAGLGFEPAGGRRMVRRRQE